MHLNHDKDNMTAPYFTDPPGNRQARFIPYQAFDGRYLDILYHSFFPDILTITEKELLKVLNEYAFMDGLCYPRQATLAGRLGCTPRQIRRRFTAHTFITFRSRPLRKRWRRYIKN